MVSSDAHPAIVEPDWPAPASVRACTTVRTGGVSRGPYASLNLGQHVGDDEACVIENRRRLHSRLQLPADPAWLDQIHGTRVLDLDADGPPLPEWSAGAGAERGGGGLAAGEPLASLLAGGSDAANACCADAVVTARAGAVCAIMTADCLPVLLADRRGRAVGAAHAGWRGLAAGVLPAAVAALECAPDDVMAWLGPAIGPDSFEVGDEVRDAFDAAGFNTDAVIVRNARGRWLADLYALATESLRGAGVTAIFGGGFCTFTDESRFFSHRRAAPCGRMATLIWME